VEYITLTRDIQINVPRYTYLPLLIPEIRENLVELYLDEQALAETDEKEWWFEEVGDEGGFASQGACRWYVPPSTKQSMTYSSMLSNY